VSLAIAPLVAFFAFVGAARGASYVSLGDSYTAGPRGAADALIAAIG
jgi:hypothetical protein